MELELRLLKTWVRPSYSYLLLGTTFLSFCSSGLNLNPQDSSNVCINISDPTFPTPKSGGICKPSGQCWSVCMKFFFANYFVNYSNFAFENIYTLNHENTKTILVSIEKGMY